MLLEAARSAREHAFARFSDFRVGAAIRTQSGEIFTGCNIENESYSLSICAERVAVFNAVSSRGPDVEISDLLVFADADSCSPCGACRQVVLQFGDTCQVTYLQDGRWVRDPISTLLPSAFRVEG